MKKTIEIECTEEEYEEIKNNLDERGRANAMLAIVRTLDIVKDLKAAGWKPEEKNGMMNNAQQSVHLTGGQCAAK